MVLLGELVQHALDTAGARQWTPSGVKGAGNGVKKRAIGLLVARYFMLWFGVFLFRNNGQRLRENFQWRGQRIDCRVDCRFRCLCNTCMEVLWNASQSTFQPLVSVGESINTYYP